MKRTLRNDYSYNNRNFTGDFNFLFFQLVCDFFNRVKFSELLVGKLFFLGGGRKDQKAGNLRLTLSFYGLGLFFFIWLFSLFFPFVQIVICFNLKEN